MGTDVQAQRYAALQTANGVRRAKKELKARIKSGDEILADLIAEPPPCIESALVRDALPWAPGVGKRKTTSLLRASKVSPTRPLGELTRHERQRLIGVLRERDRLRAARA